MTDKQFLGANTHSAVTQGHEHVGIPLKTHSSSSPLCHEYPALVELPPLIQPQVRGQDLGPSERQVLEENVAEDSSAHQCFMSLSYF